MKKIEFKFKNLVLVKGCPTDFNGNAMDDDDYNNDDSTDQDDADYFQGYMDGYGGTDLDEAEDDSSSAYLSGIEDGSEDHDDDFTLTIGMDGQEIYGSPESVGPGPDILNEEFDAEGITLPDGTEDPRY